MQFLNSIWQIWNSDSVSAAEGLSRYLHWQIRRLRGQFPVDLTISKSTLRADRPCGVAGLVNAMNEYDYNNMEMLRFVLSAGERTFFDIGANIGSYTLVASEVPGARVVSIEPHPETFARLTANVMRNGRNNVTCLNLALSDREEILDLTDGPEPAINQIVSSGASQGRLERTIRVRGVPLHAMCEDLSVTPDIIKIDVEGYEEKVLGGFGKFSGVASMLFVEGGESERVRAWMSRAGYQGPWFVDFNRRVVGRKKRDRPEDPVYVSKDCQTNLERLGFRFALY